MNSNKQLNQRKLQHLHDVSQALFPSSPAVSAHTASRVNATADAAGIQLADSTWRKTCACCGYPFVPGWTATVRIRGLGNETSPMAKKRKDDKKDEAAVSHDHDAVSKKEVKMRTVSLRRRKRGKRTRGSKKAAREDTGGAALLHTAEQQARLQSVPASGSAPAAPIKSERVRPSKPAAKEPRIVYACKICDRKTVHALPIKQTASEPATDKASKDSMQPSDSLESNPSVVTLRPTPAATNATAKKRAKSRKNTLSEMLAKEQANRAAAGSNTSGFGLDLMDFMKTS